MYTIFIVARDHFGWWLSSFLWPVMFCALGIYWTCSLLLSLSQSFFSQGRYYVFVLPHSAASFLYLCHLCFWVQVIYNMELRLESLGSLNMCHLRSFRTWGLTIHGLPRRLRSNPFLWHTGTSRIALELAHLEFCPSCDIWIVWKYNNRSFKWHLFPL